MEMWDWDSGLSKIKKGNQIQIFYPKTLWEKHGEILIVSMIIIVLVHISN